MELTLINLGFVPFLVYATIAIVATIATLVGLGKDSARWTWQNEEAHQQRLKSLAAEARHSITVAWLWPLRLVRAVIVKIFGNAYRGLCLLWR